MLRKAVCKNGVTLSFTVLSVFVPDMVNATGAAPPFLQCVLRLFPAW